MPATLDDVVAAINAQTGQQQAQFDSLLQTFDTLFEQLGRLSYMLLVSQGGFQPTTQVAASFPGNQLGTTSAFKTLYTNNSDHLISIRAVGNFAVPGSGVILSLSPSAAQQIDALSSNGKVISSPIWVRPGGSIYIGSSNTVFSLAGTVFQVLIFDPKAVSGSLGNTDVTG